MLTGPYGGIAEGPAWDGHALLFTIILKSLILRFDPQTNSITEHRTDTNRANGLIFDSNGVLYGCCAGSRSVVRFEANGYTTIADCFDGKRLNTPNDLAVDRQGRVWFTNPWNESNIDPNEKMEVDHQEVLRADPEPDGSWSVKRMTYDTTKTNGILMSQDETILYVVQSDPDMGRLRELRAYPVNSDGSLDPYTVLHQFGEDHRGTHRGIDGMCLDSNGNIIATAGWDVAGPGPMIYIFAPSGRVLETHPLPVDEPTNCTFGDADLSSLYVTTLDGHLLRARNTGLKGWHLWPPAE